MLIHILNFLSLSIGVTLIIFSNSFEFETPSKKNFTKTIPLIILFFLLIYQLLALGFFLSFVYAIMLFTLANHDSDDGIGGLSAILGIIFFIKAVFMLFFS